MKETYEQLLGKIGVTPEVMTKARQRQTEQGGFLRENLIALGEFTEETFSKAISDQLRVSYVNLEQITISDKVLGLLSREQAEKYLAIPLELDERHRRLSVVMAAPTDMSTIDELKFVVGYTLIPKYAPEEELLEAIAGEYSHFEDQQAVAVAWAAQAPESETQRRIIDLASLAEANTTISQLIEAMFSVAHARRASEIHIKPHTDGVHLCLRINGKVSETARFPQKLTNPLISRVKRLLGTEAGEYPRFFHKGSITVKLQNKKELDGSYLIYPTVPGEEILIKIKDRTDLPTLQDLAIHPKALQDLQKACYAHYGMMLVTGTARSGLTTTLYTLLKAVDAPHLNVLSVEDPIECDIGEDIIQGQVSPETGQTYAQYVHYILDQCPDVVMFDKVFDAGMIRNFFHISSGSLLLSSLAAVDSASAAIKLVLMSDRRLVADHVTCITSQRLVKKICEACKEKVSLAEAYREKLGLLPEDGCYVGKGCEKCGGTGYAGLIPIFEVMPVTHDIKRAIMESCTVKELRDLMANEDIWSLRDDGMRKVKQGLATVQDVLKATML